MFSFFLRAQDMTDEEIIRRLKEDCGKGTEEGDKSRKEKEVVTEYLHRKTMRRMT
jgi:hypothetical protein